MNMVSIKNNQIIGLKWIINSTKRQIIPENPTKLIINAPSLEEPKN